MDILERQEAARKATEQRIAQLELQLAQKQGLPADLKNELEWRKAMLNNSSAENIDPLYKALQRNFADNGQTVQDHPDGMFDIDSSNQAAFVAVFGILMRDGQVNSGWDFVGKKQINTSGATATTTWTYELKEVNPGLAVRFAKSVSLAHGEYAYKALHRAVTLTLIENSQGKNQVYAKQIASVYRTLVSQGVKAENPYLKVRILTIFEGLEGGKDDAPPSSIAIDLPDLEEQADVLIVADNLRAQQALYFSAMLEEFKVYQVVDKLVELFQFGMLPLGKGTAGDMLYGYWKKSVNRITELERRTMYARCFGIPGGETGGNNLNREFDELFLRFVSAVSAFVRQFSIDALLRAKIPLTVNMQQVHKSGKDLASNLSLHGYGIAYFAATELQTQMKDIFAILNDPEIKSAYGARDAYQLIDQVATLELGGARNSTRYRTMATSGAIIIGWLATKAQLLNSPARVRILDIDQLGDAASPSDKPMVNPNDRDLVDACEQWLAVTGTGDNRVEEYSQPSESPMVTSAPIRIPDVAREMLQSAGVPVGLSKGIYH